MREFVNKNINQYFSIEHSIIEETSYQFNLENQLTQKIAILNDYQNRSDFDVLETIKLTCEIVAILISIYEIREKIKIKFLLEEKSKDSKVDLSEYEQIIQEIYDQELKKKK